jgi:hypothetical protein
MVVLGLLMVDSMRNTPTTIAFVVFLILAVTSAMMTMAVDEERDSLGWWLLYVIVFITFVVLLYVVYGEGVTSWRQVEW